MQNSTQLDLFAVDANGAIRVTWEAGNGVWQNGRNNTAPAMITPPGYAVPGSSLACGQQGDDQLDVFFVRNGNIWVTWERGDSAWADGLPGHPTPVPITQSNLVPPEASLIAAKLSDTQLNVFFIDIFGAIRTVQVEGYGTWQELPISGPDQFAPGASLAVIAQGDGPASLFAISNLGTIVVFNKTKDTDWPMPTPASPQGFAPLTAWLAAADWDITEGSDVCGAGSSVGSVGPRAISCLGGDPDGVAGSGYEDVQLVVTLLCGGDGSAGSSEVRRSDGLRIAAEDAICP